MFKKFLFAGSGRELALASSPVLDSALVWASLALVEAGTEAFIRSKQPTGNTQSHVERLQDRVCSAMFGSNFHQAIGDFARRRHSDPVYFEMARLHEAGQLALSGVHRPGDLPLTSLWPSSLGYGLKLPGYRASLGVLGFAGDVLNRTQTSTYDTRGAQSFCKRVKPFLADLRAQGTPGSLAAAELVELMDGWQSGDRALCVVP